ncbi:hypothetical protein [Leclercia adecarboxylata]|uniref:hypothetical protein n=1 Tax=Leclercia adecarboxylata TaxID=83655 RepID=UPI0013FD345E|nr:hypothetical protein [Leclercia adecarboxylata]QIM42033.1 hypothetical protein G7098_04460 [Leclercia adecarboxylata]
MTEKADAITVRTIMEQFVKDEGVKARLQMIRDRNTNDWEKWLQVELQYFISKLPKVHVEREIRATPDKRMLRNRKSMSVDLVLSKSRKVEKSYIFIELKCTRDVQPLINGFNQDIEKINSIRLCNYNLQSAWYVGFHLNCSKLSIEKIKNHLSYYPHSYHDVIRLCKCIDDDECQCKNKSIGLAIL